MAVDFKFNPWLRMLVRPKKTILAITDKDPNYRIWVLSTLYGFVALLGMGQNFTIGTILPFHLIVLLAVVLAPYCGYLLFSLMAFFIMHTGRWLGGKGSFLHIRAAIAWSNVPVVFNILMWIVLLFYFRDAIFLQFPGSYLLTNGEVLFLFALFLLQVIAMVWILGLYVSALSAVQKFSLWRAIFNILLAGLASSYI